VAETGFCQLQWRVRDGFTPSSVSLSHYISLLSTKKQTEWQEEMLTQCGFILPFSGQD
jgi:hypothetical protein